jgi:hypothetical protein
MMKVVRTSETSIRSNQTTRYCIPEGSRLHTCRRENLKSNKVITIFFVNAAKHSFISWRFAAVVIKQKWVNIVIFTSCFVTCFIRNVFYVLSYYRFSLHKNGWFSSWENHSRIRNWKILRRKLSFRIVFCDVLPCKIIVIPDDGGSTYLWKVGRQLFYTAVHPRRQFWTSYSTPWEVEISQSGRCLI